MPSQKRIAANLNAKGKRKPLTLADVECVGQPECFHCDAELPKTARAVKDGNYLLVTCPNCGCMTPFECWRTQTDDARTKTT